MGLLYAMAHGSLVHFRGKFRVEIEGLKIKAALFSRWECSTKVPNNLVSIIMSHLNFDTTFRISRPFSVNGLNVKHQLSPELNKNFAICNIYPNREPKDFSEKKKDQ